MTKAQDAPIFRSRWPIIGHMPGFFRDSLALMRRAERECGPVFWCDAGFGLNVLMVLGEEGFEIFRSKECNSSHLSMLETVLGQSMLPVDGREHRRMRGASGHAFTPAGLGRAQVAETIADAVLRHIGKWRGRSEIPVVLDTRAIALEVIFQVMGVEVKDLPEWSRHYGDYILAGLNIPFEFPGSPNWRGKRARRWLEQRLAVIIADVRARGDQVSMVGAMAHGRDESGAGLSEVELVDNLMVLGFAGHETTASVMAWSMIHLANSPEHWDRLVAEATALPELPRDFASLAAQVPLAVGAFRESLRLYPPVAQQTRFVHTPFEIAGYAVDVGTTVGTSFLIASRAAGLYDEPNQWRPERWIGRERKPTPIENCQFGGGAHFCLGYHMALLEGTMFLVQVARTLAEWGVRPTLKGELPKARYIPLVHPPRKTRLRLV